jgi:hypothetical protein
MQENRYRAGPKPRGRYGRGFEAENLAQYAIQHASTGHNAGSAGVTSNRRKKSGLTRTEAVATLTRRASITERGAQDNSLPVRG